MKVRAEWAEMSLPPRGEESTVSDPRLAGSPRKGHSRLTENELEDTGLWQSTVTSRDFETAPGRGQRER